MNFNRSRLARLGAGLLVSCAFAAPVLAQDADGGEEEAVLSTITVSGQREGTAATATTPTTVEISRETLDAAQVRDISEINRLDPAVNFSAGNRSINVRGLDQARVLTTVDGVRVPWLQDGARGLTGGVSAINFETLSRIDVVKGSDSSVFGAGALGGVVAFRTLNPEDLLPNGKTFGGLSRLSFDSKDGSWSAEQALAARLRDTYFLFQGGYREGNEIENRGDVGGFGPLRTEKEPRDYDRQNYLAKIRQHFEGGHVVGLTAERFDRSDDVENLTASQLPLTGTYLPGTPRIAESDKRDRVSLNYEYTPDGGGLISAADAVVYWQKQEIDSGLSAIRRSIPAGPFSRLAEREETTLGANANAVASFDTGSVTHDIGFGGEIFGSRSSQFSSGVDGCPVLPDGVTRYTGAFSGCNFLHTNQADMPDVDGLTVGLYVQDEIGFHDDRLRLTPGLRFDWYRATPEETEGFRNNPSFNGLPEESSDAAFSPKLRAEWDWMPGVTLYSQWAQAFRAPTPSELYLSFGGPGTYLRIGNPELEPETSNGFDVGAILGDKERGGAINLFYNRYENFIDVVSVSAAEAGVPEGTYPFGITGVANRARVDIWGAEVSGHWQFDANWRLAASVGAYVGVDRETDEHLNSIPAAKGIVDLGYTAEEWGANAVVTLAAARDEVENELSRTPGYGLLDLSAWWQPSQVEGMRLTAGVYNVFDKKYFDALDIPDSTTQAKDYFTEAGRTFKASVSYQF
ncbi:MAG: hypothetical protein DI629_00940 [Mesorhizobium amorphae]|nr:MAG: hypothetical protein DI629_00940 [Mesorhizobium amorphae]